MALPALLQDSLALPVIGAPMFLVSGPDPDNLPPRDKTAMNFGSGSAKAWRDIWGSGQGVGSILDVPPTAELVARLKREVEDARARLRHAAG